MSIKSKRQQNKDQRKATRKYIGAWVESKFGYYITGTFSFIKQLFKQYFEIKYIVLLCIVGVIFSLVLAYSHIQQYQDAKHRIATYEPKLETSKKESESSADKANSVRKQLTEATSKQSTVVKNASDQIDTLMDDMYEYDSQKDYDINRNNAKDLFKDSKIPKNIYGTGYDKDGESIIDNLNMTSDVNSVQTFNTDKDNKSSDVLKLKTIVSYKSEIEGTSNSNASHTHEIVYDIKVDAENNKIMDIKKAKDLKTEFEVDAV